MKGDRDGKDTCPYMGFPIWRKKQTKTKPKPLQNQQKNSKKPLCHFEEFCHHKRRNTKRFRKGESELLAWCVGISPSKVYFVFFLEISRQTCVPGDRYPCHFVAFRGTVVLLNYSGSSQGRSWAGCGGVCSHRWALRCVDGTALLVTLCKWSLLPSCSRNKVERPTKAICRL